MVLRAKSGTAIGFSVIKNRMIGLMKSMPLSSAHRIVLTEKFLIASRSISKSGNTELMWGVSFIIHWISTKMLSEVTTFELSKNYSQKWEIQVLIFSFKFCVIEEKSDFRGWHFAPRVDKQQISRFFEDHYTNIVKKFQTREIAMIRHSGSLLVGIGLICSAAYYYSNQKVHHPWVLGRVTIISLKFLANVKIVLCWNLFKA